MKNDSSLIVEDLRVTLGSFHLSVPFLKVEAGSIAVVMGKSGSGKSTLLKTIAGFIKPESGSIWNRGREISEVPPEERKLALVLQQPALFSHLTVAQNVAFGLKLQRGISKQAVREKVDSWLTRLKISELSGRYPHQISGGQAQRTALARAFVVGFPGLLLDEPFSALDESLREEMRATLKALVKETKVTAVLVTHDKQEANEIADEIIYLN